jgi:hypothetical protein
VASGVKAREQGEKISYGVMDPAAFSSDGGPSIAERMLSRGVGFHRADNARVAKVGAIGGWDHVRHRLNGDEDGRAMLFFFSSCGHIIRTLPVLQHDEIRPEDVMTASEDHAADMLRYACASRPWIPSRPKPKKPLIDTKIPTIGEMVKDMERRKRSSEGRI